MYYNTYFRTNNFHNVWCFQVKLEFSFFSFVNWLIHVKCESISEKSLTSTEVVDDYIAGKNFRGWFLTRMRRAEGQVHPEDGSQWKQFVFKTIAVNFIT